MSLYLLGRFNLLLRVAQAALKGFYRGRLFERVGSEQVGHPIGQADQSRLPQS
jgi:hypothetical protein